MISHEYTDLEQVINVDMIASVAKTLPLDKSWRNTKTNGISKQSLLITGQNIHQIATTLMDCLPWKSPDC